jgi:RNA polymerase primary sigma factor
MATINYARKLQKFFINNPDLITEYEEMTSSIPVEYCSDDIISLYTKFLKINKNLDFNRTLQESFEIAVRQGITILDAMEAHVSSEFNSSSTSSTQQYFKEINNIYNKHNNDFNIEYCPENRDKLIEMNLKSVISIAKKYQGLGLSLAELISAGNLGLVIAYDKFDPSRSKLKDNVLEAIEGLKDEFTFNELENAVSEYLSYGDVKKKFDDEFKDKKGSISKKYVIKWVNSNIYNAKFNSIATMWIRAYILIEIDNYSRIVKKPKAEIYKDRDEQGSYKREITLDIDAPVSDDSNSSVIDIMKLEDDTNTGIVISESYDTFKEGLMKLLTGVKVRDRGIFLKKFGIGLPRPMSPREIADQENLSIARVSQIFQQVLEQMQVNQVKYNVDMSTMFDAMYKIQ